MALRVHFSRKAGVGLREKILLLSGYGQGERLLPGLTGALEQAGSLRRLEAGADTGQAREAYARMTGGSGRGVAVGVGAGCVQALLLAQAFPLDALACLLPGADGRRGAPWPWWVALNNLFAITAPILVLEEPKGRLGRRIYRDAQARDKRFAQYEGGDQAILTILEHLRPICAANSLAR